MESMEILKGSNIIITGGTGFIGSHLVKELVALGAKVTVIDIILGEKSYFTEQKLDKKINLQLIDIAKRKAISDLFIKIKPDFVFHLAAKAIVEDSYANPYKTFQTNVMGTVSILEAAKFIGVKGVIVASSDKAYGKTEEMYTESSPLQGDHPYDVSKSCTDLIAQTYYKTYGLPTVITRFGNVYGEGDLHLNRIIPGICKSIIKNKTLKIRSNGQYVRDYLYVKDVVAGYIFLLKNLNKTKGEAYNFSSIDTLSVIELIQKAEKILKTKISYTIMNTAKNEIPYQHLNDKKIRKLGWKNKFTMKEVLPEIVRWYGTIV
jgi:CDP-glucose 4,6-dehydratase